ncbi:MULTISPECIES: hypothetical protein [unclassified Gilliamella]|uniref:hypothetical protein n=1 Tax=unclassified Gilliamella TaxID=2685620 RepID=UPI0013229466|nr:MULTISPECIES: hypothetical protein [unclassified Gilliamella]MWN32197.1 hypothetical protein [Gilliamella sp. Pra-s60]MWP29481.1 hypothetical protein [Gilliamella sp. Pra-s54]
MKNNFFLLKGTVRCLKVSQNSQETNTKLTATDRIEKDICSVICSIIAFICFFICCRPPLRGQYFYCYVGNKKVEGRLNTIDFKDGDYVEMLVKSPKNDVYQPYAVRIPKRHAILFPQSIGLTTFVILKISFILMSIFAVVILLFLLIFEIFNGCSLNHIFNIFKYSFLGWIIAIIAVFFMGEGGYSFFSNQIYACFGYEKPWKYDAEKEKERFKKLHRINDPEIFNDPQTPDFEKLKKFKSLTSYYCRTPILPNWVKVIDEQNKNE